MSDGPSDQRRTDALADAVDAALDDLLGPRPTALVEERAEPRSPSDENEALWYLYHSPAKFYGYG